MSAPTCWLAPGAILAVACSPAPPHPPPHLDEADRAPLVSIAPTEPAPTLAPRDGPPPGVRLPLTACVVRGAQRAGVRAHELRIAPSGRVFGRVDPRHSVGKELALPPGDRDRAVLTVANARATLSGFVSAGEVAVRMREAELLGGFFIPKPNAELVWKRAESGTVTLRYPLTLGLAAPQSFEVEVSCKSLTLDRSFFDPLEALATPPTMERPLLKPGKIELFRDRFGPIKLDLLLKSSPSVWLRETTPDRARIAWERQNEVLVGWVPLTSLDRGTTVGRPIRERTDRVVSDEVPEAEGFSCEHTLALVVGDDADLTTVGSLRAGVDIVPGVQRGELTAVEVEDLPVKLSPGVQLWVRTQALDDCKAAEPAKP